MQAIEQQLRQFVVNNFLFGQGEDQLSNHDSFLEKGIVDSTGVLELVVFLEKQYRIKVEDEELIPANLDSIDSLLRFIEKKAQIAR
ncbi:MAG TPA: acyl carrier protein [Patescibacteria group bacterium]|nr:acyl carrier protein [Patescibacteria group bacterium]